MSYREEKEKRYEEKSKKLSVEIQKREKELEKLFDVYYDASNNTANYQFSHYKEESRLVTKIVNSLSNKVDLMWIDYYFEKLFKETNFLLYEEESRLLEIDAERNRLTVKIDELKNKIHKLKRNN